MPVLTLGEIKDHLNITSSDYDAEIATKGAAAESALARKIGPLQSTSVTERVRGGRGQLTLSTRPVISLTSVTPVGGTALTVGDLDVDPESGVIEWDTSGTFSASRYVVAYLAGWDPLPEDLRHAVLELVAHMWKPRRGPTRQGAEPEPDATFAWPRRVIELVAPYVQLGGGS